jgi:hypothetical protein
VGVPGSLAEVVGGAQQLAPDRFVEAMIGDLDPHGPGEPLDPVIDLAPVEANAVAVQVHRTGGVEQVGQLAGKNLGSILSHHTMCIGRPGRSLEGTGPPAPANPH